MLEQPVIDESKFPMDGPVYDGVESFRIEWTPRGDLQTVEDGAKYFRIDGREAVARAEFQVVVPEQNFSFRGTATSTIAFVGAEVHGYYYMNGEQPPEHPFPVLDLAPGPLSR